MKLTLKDFFPTLAELDSFVMSIPAGHIAIVNQTRGWLQLWKIDGKKLVRTIKTIRIEGE